MDERGIFSDLQSYHTGGGDNIPTSNDPFASEVTLDPELLGDLSNNTAEDLPSTGGSNYGRTAAQTHSNQDSYPRQAFPYTAPSVPAQLQHSETLSRNDLASQQHYPSQFQNFEHPPFQIVHDHYGTFSGHSSHFAADSFPNHGNLTLGQSRHPLSDPNPIPNSFQTMPEERRPSQNQQRSRHTPSEPMRKRRRFGAATAEIDATYTPNTQKPSSITAPPQIPRPKVHTLQACRLWAWCHPDEKPTVQMKEDLSILCEEDSSVVDCIFTAREDRSNDAETLNVRMETAGELWKAMHPDTTPLRWQVMMLSRVIGASQKSLSNWFVRNQRDLSRSNDSAYGTLTDTVTHLDREIASRRFNRKQCKPNPEVKSSLQRSSSRIYICTSLCGQKFDSKDTWKKHEENNRMQKAWLCDFRSCRKNADGFIWARKESLMNHVEKHHPDFKHNYQARYIEIKANVRGNCLWRTCTETFKSHKDFSRHMKKHFEKDWEAADLRNPEDETDAPESLLSAHSGNHGFDFQDNNNDDEDPSSPNAGAGPSSGHQPSHGCASGSGNPGSGSGSLAPDNSGTGRSGASGNRMQTCSSNAMQLKSVNPLKTLQHSASACLGTNYSLSARQIWQQMVSWSPRLDFLGRLGSGATAVVDEVSIAGVSGTLACKTIPTRWRFDLFQELQTMSKLRHPHIVALFHAFLRAGVPSILMQPVADCNLSQYLAKKAFTPTEQCNMWLWFSCLTSGLHHMHEQGVLHHDIKPSNILVMDKTIFYADFGYSASMSDNQAHHFSRWGFTRIYAAPEVFRGDQKMASDVFSLGCVFLEMITVLLSKDLRQQLHNLQTQSWQKNHTSLHWASQWNNTLLSLSGHQMAGSNVHDLLQICRTMTDPQPSQRPSVAEVEERLNPRLCRSCSYSTEWRSKKTSTWPLDQSALELLGELNAEDQGSSNADESIPSLVSEIGQTSQSLDQLSLTETWDSEAGLSEASENKTIYEVNVDHNTDIVRGMMSSYLEDQDPYERFRASGQSMLPKLSKFVGLPSQYPTFM